jgi:hypothetical protein
VSELARQGLKVDYRSVWEFVHAECQPALNIGFFEVLCARQGMTDLSFESDQAGVPW